MKYVVAYLVVAAVFLIIDYFWLSYVMKDMFDKHVGHLLAENFNMGVAAGFYLLFGAAIVMFCVSPALASGSWVTALLYGAAFGFFTYGTYDATNLATLKDWPVFLAAIDTAWGTGLTALSATVGYFVTKAIYGVG